VNNTFSYQRFYREYCCNVVKMLTLMGSIYKIKASEALKLANCGLRGKKNWIQKVISETPCLRKGPCLYL